MSMLETVDDEDDLQFLGRAGIHKTSLIKYLLAWINKAHYWRNIYKRVCLYDFCDINTLSQSHAKCQSLAVSKRENIGVLEQRAL
jgi:hypothetical protein